VNAFLWKRTTHWFFSWSGCFLFSLLNRIYYLFSKISLEFFTFCFLNIWDVVGIIARQHDICHVVDAFSKKEAYAIDSFLEVHHFFLLCHLTCHGVFFWVFKCIWFVIKNWKVMDENNSNVWRLNLKIIPPRLILSH
jgi:hypothetical protein